MNNQQQLEIVSLERNLENLVESFLVCGGGHRFKPRGEKCLWNSLAIQRFY